MMEREERRAFILMGVICLLIILIGYWESGTQYEKVYQRSPVSQTVPTEKYSNVRFIIDNTTEIQLWSDNGTELTYKGKIENFSNDSQYKIWIKKSIVDSIKINEVQP